MSRCSVAHSDATLCNADAAGRCIWDLAQGLCKLGCPFLTVESEAAAPSVAFANGSPLVASARSAARPSRRLRTAAQTPPSNIASRCSWDPDMNPCGRRCNMTRAAGHLPVARQVLLRPAQPRLQLAGCLKTPLAECSANQRCVLRDWGMGNVQCLMAPEIRDSTAAACVNDPRWQCHVGRVQASSAGPNATAPQHRRMLDQLHEPHPLGWQLHAPQQRVRVRPCSKHIFSTANVTLEACGADPFCLTSANNTCTPGCQLLGLFSCNANPNCI
jgi:hypothetical protein